MSLHFIDSSALVKRYVDETGSAWIRALADPEAGNGLIIARVSWVEVLSALARKQREGNLAAAAVQAAIDAFRYDMDMQYQVTELDRSLAEMAGDLVSRYPLHAYDAIQLASALRLNVSLVSAGSPGLLFLSADDRLLRIGRTEGLAIDNPSHHPNAEAAA